MSTTPGTKIPVVLFTHPTCVGCSEAIRRMTAFAGDHQELQFRITSLAGTEGQALADRWNVKSVPTIIFNDDPQMRIVGVPKAETLDALYQAIKHGERRPLRAEV